MVMQNFGCVQHFGLCILVYVKMVGNDAFIRFECEYDFRKVSVVSALRTIKEKVIVL